MKIIQQEKNPRIALLLKLHIEETSWNHARVINRNPILTIMLKRISIKEDLNKDNYLPLNKALTADEKKKKS